MTLEAWGKIGIVGKRGRHAGSNPFAVASGERHRGMQDEIRRQLDRIVPPEIVEVEEAQLPICEPHRIVEAEVGWNQPPLPVRQPRAVPDLARKLTFDLVTGDGKTRAQKPVEIRVGSQVGEARVDLPDDFLVNPRAYKIEGGTVVRRTPTDIKTSKPKPILTADEVLRVRAAIEKGAI